MFFTGDVISIAGMEGDRFLLEFTNDWLLIWATPAGCFFLPISSVLALACLEGGMAFWHWPVAVALFAVLLVWRLR